MANSFGLGQGAGPLMGQDAFNENQSNFLALKKIVQSEDGDLIPFVGAGLSRFGPSESRLPLWRDLVAQLLQRADENGQVDDSIRQQVLSDIEAGNLISAIGFLSRDVMGEKQFRVALSEILDVENAEIPPAVRELVSISWSIIVTTNLDDFIERAWSEKHQRQINVYTHLSTHAFSSAISAPQNSPTLLKSHGTLDVVESWILTAADYLYLLQNNDGYRDAIRTLFKRNILFLGYGMSDGDFNEIADELNAIYKYGVGQYFALLPVGMRGTPYMKEITKNYPLRPIWYETNSAASENADGGHGQVLEFLHLLSKAWIVGSHTLKRESVCMPAGESLFVGRRLELARLSAEIFQNEENMISVFGFGGEGKTTFVTKWISENLDELKINGFEYVFECSFYKADTSFFIDSAYSFLCKNGDKLSISEKITAIQRVIATKRVLFVFDGFEAMLTEDGNVAAPAIEKILSTIESSLSAAIFTTRVIPSIKSCVIDLEHLQHDEAIEILRAWNIKGTPEDFDTAIRKYIGTHALSVRIVAGYLDQTKTRHVTAIKEIASLAAIKDESDARHANKASRVLDNYWSKLSNDQRQFMEGLSMLRRSTSLDMLQGTALDELTDWEAIETDLLNRRLLVLEDEGTLTAHPLVKLFFAEKCSDSRSDTLHREYSEYFQRAVLPENPQDSFEARLLVEACFHAAQGGMWEEFHRLFDQRLNAGAKRLLGDVYGEWEEFLSLTKLALGEEESRPISKKQPSYYESAAAYALKKTGRLAEAVERHSTAALIAIDNGDPDEECARQINNCASLSIALAEFRNSLTYFRLNAAGLESISNLEKRDWQREHFLYGMGKLAYRVGQFDRSLEYYTQASNDREASDQKRGFFYDYHVVTHADTLMSVRPDDLDSARQVANAILEQSISANWYDVTAISYRTLCGIERVVARTKTDDHLTRARQYLVRAEDALALKYQPEAALEIEIETLRLELETRPPKDWENLLYRIDLAKSKARAISCFVLFQDLDALTAIVLDGLQRHGDCSQVCTRIAERAKATGANLVFLHSQDYFPDVAKKYGIRITADRSIEIPSPGELLNFRIDDEEIAQTLKSMHLSNLREQ